jgi:hypothetical protein
MENPRTVLKLFWVVIACLVVGATAAIIVHMVSK